MLPDDELEELAADIAANGLQQALVIGQYEGQTVLVDGRNRREACRRVGIVPGYILLDGQDPVTYILSANINRRHLSKGQRAIVVAKIYPESTAWWRFMISSASSTRSSGTRTDTKVPPRRTASA
jgi:hypothetical protein